MTRRPERETRQRPSSIVAETFVVLVSPGFPCGKGPEETIAN